MIYDIDIDIDIDIDRGFRTSDLRRLPYSEKSTPKIQHRYASGFRIQGFAFGVQR